MNPKDCNMRFPFQAGIALPIGLIFLLLLTIVGIAAVRMTTQQSRMTANYQFQTATFQAAESQIRRIMSELRGEILPPVGESQVLIAAMNLGESPVTPLQRSVDVDTFDPNNSSITTKDFTAPAGCAGSAPCGLLVYTGDGPVPNYSLGASFTGHMFQIDARAALLNTGANSQHLQGLVRVGPSGE
jgi:type IV pilus assembly protein PilX